MSGLGMDRHTRRRKERRGKRRKSGTDQDLGFAVKRVKRALRNSPTQILRIEDTRVLEVPDRHELQAGGYVPDRGRFLLVPLKAARKALFALREIWGGAGLD